MGRHLGFALLGILLAAGIGVDPQLLQTVFQPPTSGLSGRVKLSCAAPTSGSVVSIRNWMAPSSWGLDP